jgi:hypothetical protein
MGLLDLSGWTNGSSLSATVDAVTRLRPVNRANHGICIHSLTLHGPYPFDTNGNYTIPASVETAARDLLIPFVRIYAGYEDKLRLGSWSLYADRLAFLLDRIGVSPENCIVCISYRDSSSEVPPSEYAAGVAALRAIGVRRYELENEPYNRQWRTSPPWSRFSYDSDGEAQYEQYLLAVWSALQDNWRDGDILLVNKHPGYSASYQYWHRSLLLRTMHYWQQVAQHRYMPGTVSRNAYNISFERWVIAVTKQYTAHLLQDLDLGSKCVTEWWSSSVNSDPGHPAFPNRDGNIYGLIMGAYRLMYVHEMAGIRSCTKWHLFDGNYANVEETKRYLVLKPYMPGKRGYSYWLFYYLNRYIGDWLHPVSGTAPIVTLQDSLNQNQTALKTPVMVTSTSNRIYIWLLNCDWSNTVNASITISGRTVSSASGVMFKRDDPDEQGWTDETPTGLVSNISASVSNNTVSLTLQPHSLTLLEVS